MSVYLFFDESGNLDFSPNGSRYFIFGALTTRTPAAFSRQLSELRYGLLDRGVELEAFHAAEDRQAVRDEVFRLITSIVGFDSTSRSSSREPFRRQLVMRCSSIQDSQVVSSGRCSRATRIRMNA